MSWRLQCGSLALEQRLGPVLVLVIGGFGGVEGEGVSSELLEEALHSSDGKRKLDESEDGGVSEVSDGSMCL
jgi:hypothetical protein